MKKLFRRTGLKPPKYPSHEAAGLSRRAVAAAGLIVATAAGGCIPDGATAGEPAIPYLTDGGIDAGRDATVFLTDSGGIAPYPDAAVEDDAGTVPPAPDAGE